MIGTSDAEREKYMSNLRQAAERAVTQMLSVAPELECHYDDYFEAIETLRKALAEPEPELKPVVGSPLTHWVEYLKRLSDNGKYMKIPSGLSAGSCYELAIEMEQFIGSAPPRQWAGLTEDDIDQAITKTWEEGGLSPHDDTIAFARAIEAKLREKNHDRT